MIRKIAAALMLLGGAANAHATVIGFVEGPDDTSLINLGFTNLMNADLTELVLMGATATGANGAIIWDSLGTLGGSAVVATSAGADTDTATFTFTSFGLNDTFTLSAVDPDAALSASVIPLDLIGVTVSALYADLTTELYTFVDDPTPGAGLMLQANAVPVPEPATLLLLLSGAGFLGLAGLRRRRA